MPEGICGINKDQREGAAFAGFGEPANNAAIPQIGGTHRYAKRPIE